MASLTIYKASAGSGKTYTITGEYIRLLFENPDNYRHILGVTFTNKATAEMKSRIISELHKLSIGSPSGYAADIDMPADKVKQLAGYILNKILHDYSHFTISTIDSFFQRVIRAFAREIGFYQGFEIELDQQKVLSSSVDQMIFNIETQPELKQWLIRFAEEKIFEGRTWNINSDIEKLGRELFKENYKELADQLFVKISDRQFMDNYNRKLKAKTEEIEVKIRALANEALVIIERSGLEIPDFKGLYGAGHFFDRTYRRKNYNDWKISNTILKHYNNPEAWYSKKSNKQPIIEDAYYQGLNYILGDLIAIYNNEFVLYKSIVAIQKNFYVLGMIADLHAQVKQYSSDKNLFLISDTTELLYKLIRGSDAPFVFERTGSFINHFMIDEFQDTSMLQWKNFKPLIINSLAENNQNWVVGDVKQSIYRWRNSDWTILSEKIFEDVYPHETEVKTLKYNWRSSYNIVKFNNSFFRNALDEVIISNSKESDNNDGHQDEFIRVLQNAYSDFPQLVPDTRKNDKGWVHFEFVEVDNKRTKDWKADILVKLPNIIEKLQDNGYNLSEIAILVRDKKDARLISDYFLSYQRHSQGNYRYDVISGDSLLLKNAEIVKWLISCYRYIADPADMENKAFFVYEYNQFIQHGNTMDAQAIFIPGDILSISQDVDLYFMSPDLKHRSIYELTDEIIKRFGLHKLKNEIPYLQAFQDLLQEYVKREPVDIYSFLTWWEEHENDKVISMPDNQDAMRLMTFHTSKGLEFPVVLIPFGDWEILKPGRAGQILWCNPEHELLNDLELVPVNLSTDLDKTFFKDDYLREKAMLSVDNLNLLYVAFTRAIDALIVFAPDLEHSEIKNNVSALIKNSLVHQGFDIRNANYPADYLPKSYQFESNIFDYGFLEPKKRQQKAFTGWHLNDIEYTVRKVSDVTKQVIPSYDYIVGNNESGFLESRMNMGKIMHELFEYIRTANDVDDAITHLLLEGKISYKDKDVLKSKVLSFISQELVKDWFSNELTIKNEVSIVLPNGSLSRPDRVILKSNEVIVVDYKFGEEESANHLYQVSRYMQSILKMGYKNVKGFVWYLNQNKIVRVGEEEKPRQLELF